MSTRAQIKYKDSEFNIHIYRHSDGYPEGTHGVLRVLVPFVEAFFKSRGDDECYFLGQLMRRFAIDDYKRDITDQWRIDHPEYRAENSFLGWGLDSIRHEDIDYLYEVDSKGNIYINGKKQSKAKLKALIKDEGVES